jgi:hypothetical protein
MSLSISDMLALAQKFSPLLNLGSKAVKTLSEGELRQVAACIVGDAADEFLPILMTVRDGEPETLVSDLLSSPTAVKLFSTLKQKIVAAREEHDNSVFIKCSHCDRLSEVTLQT